MDRAEPTVALEPSNYYSPEEVELALALERITAGNTAYPHIWRSLRSLIVLVVLVIVPTVAITYLFSNRNFHEIRSGNEYMADVNDQVHALEQKFDAIADQRGQRIQALEDQVAQLQNPPTTTTIARRRGTAPASPPASSPAGAARAPSTPAEVAPSPVPPPATSVPPQVTNDDFDRPRESYLLCIPGLLCIG